MHWRSDCLRGPCIPANADAMPGTATTWSLRVAHNQFNFVSTESLGRAIIDTRVWCMMASTAAVRAYVQAVSSCVQSQDAAALVQVLTLNPARHWGGSTFVSGLAAAATAAGHGAPVRAAAVVVVLQWWCCSGGRADAVGRLGDTVTAAALRLRPRCCLASHDTHMWASPLLFRDACCQPYDAVVRSVAMSPRSCLDLVLAHMEAVVCQARDKHVEACRAQCAALEHLVVLLIDADSAWLGHAFRMMVIESRELCLRVRAVLQARWPGFAQWTWR